MDPTRNFPELADLPLDERKKLFTKVQRQVMLKPTVLGGLLALAIGFALIMYMLMEAKVLPGALQGAAFGGGIAALFIVYLILVVRPRMREEFARLGYPEKAQP